MTVRFLSEEMRPGTWKWVADCRTCASSPDNIGVRLAGRNGETSKLRVSISAYWHNLMMPEHDIVVRQTETSFPMV